ACAGMTVLGGLRKAEVGISTCLGVIGIGGQGHLAIQLGKAMGAKVVAMDIDAVKLSMAKELGADLAYDVSKSDDLPELMALDMDVVMVTAPSDEAHSLALLVVAYGGVISLCAVPGGETPISMTLCGFKGVRLLAQAVATRKDLADILELAAQGKVSCEVEARSLDAGPDSIKALREGKVVGRVVFVP
ncbi:MAG: zinc-binding dehydrogenase, partial [Pseudomonadota bacterium]